jgi:stage V sporulation protein R
MNEGYATFWHYTILNRLYELGLADDGFMLEWLHVHTNVVAQRGYDQPGYGGMNPYALGFAMFRDIRRVCEDPTAEDVEWFPSMAGTDWKRAIDFAMRNYKDESFVTQYLSPKAIRDFRLFAVADHRANPFLEIDAIHDDRGYRRVRKLLAQQHDRDATLPNIQVMSYDRHGDRSLVVRYTMSRMRPLADDYKRVAQHLADLWGFRVRFEFEADEKSRFYEHFEPMR